MQIRLKNIGIVKDSVISVNGLTVITGKNNSGKTTVGKALYSLLDAVSNIQAKARNDRASYISKSLDDIMEIMDGFRFFRYAADHDRRLTEEGNPLSQYPTLFTFILRNYKLDLSLPELEDFAHKLYDELLSLDIEVLAEDTIMQNFLRRYVVRGSEVKGITDLISKQREKALSALSELFSTISKDPQLIDYTRESISQTLRVEFANQIQPVSVNVDSSTIELYNDDSLCFNITIRDNRVVNDGTPVFVSSPYKKVYLIDNPFVLDNSPTFRRMVRRYTGPDNDSVLDLGRILTHEEKLRYTLRRKIQPTVLEQTVINASIEKIKQDIDAILPGTFEFSSEGEFYIQSGSKLRISNLATGSKMFSIMKILLEQGELGGSTMLILDEPEAHLHPAWQNLFAEVIVLLVRELGVNILLTTHSSNFVLALDAYMRKYSIEEKTNFYQTDFLEGGLIEYICANDNIGAIYQDFLEYLSEVKMLRNECIRNTGDEK